MTKRHKSHMKAINNKTVVGSILFILIAAASRLITALPNFSVIEAMALFGGAYLATRLLAFVVPIAALYLSDLFMNNTILRAFFPDVDGIVWWSDYMIWNFISILFIVFLGMNLLKKITPARVIGTSFLASIIFFLLTNLGTWYYSSMYADDFSGLMACYAAAIPFFQNSILGTLFFSTMFFGAFEIFKSFTLDAKDLVVEKVRS